MQLTKNVAIALVVVGLAAILVYVLVRRERSFTEGSIHTHQDLGEPEPPRREFGRPRR